MKGKKKLLGQIMCNKWLLPLARCGVERHYLNILAYHRVMDFDISSYPFDEELISASIDSFDKQMKFVAESFNVVTFEDLSRSINNQKSLPKNPLVITFDDGYADNYDNAFPILKKYGLKGVFFVSTDYMNSKIPFWFESVIFLCKKQILTAGNLKEITGLDNFLGRNCTPFLLCDYLIRIPNQERLELLKRIWEKTNLDVNNPIFEQVRAMTWKQITEMSDSGMEVGSHTQSHLILGNASLAEVEKELEQSKLIIEEKIDKPVISVSYPVGGYPFSINEDVISAAVKLNYKWGISYFSGTNKIIKGNEFMLKRLRIERYTELCCFRALLLYPGIFS